MVIQFSRLFLAATVACAAACSVDAPPPDPPDGTYTLQLCRVRCAGPDDANTLATGHLVLLDSAIDTGALRRQDSVGRILADFFAFDQSDAPPNGCFLWEKRRDDPPSYGTGFGGGLLHWDRQDDTVRFQLYGSPDAGHYVTLALESGRLIGRGVSSGYGADSIPEDVVVARRAGRSDASLCRQAGVALWEDLRRYRTERRDSMRTLHN